MRLSQDELLLLLFGSDVVVDLIRGTWDENDGSRQTIADFWQLSLPIYPNGPNNSKTDVMLVQGMLKIACTSNALPQTAQAEAVAILTAGSKTRRFDDGVYGPRTRALLGLFEEHTGAPYKDGIVRPAPAAMVAAAMAGARQYTKLIALNTIWDDVLDATGGGSPMGVNKMSQGRRILNPVCWKELYKPQFE